MCYQYGSQMSLSRGFRPSPTLYKANRSAIYDAFFICRNRNLGPRTCKASQNPRKAEGVGEPTVAIGFGKDFKKRSASSSKQTTGGGVGNSRFIDDTLSRDVSSTKNAGESFTPQVGGPLNSVDGGVGRQQVLSTCVKVSVGIALVGVVLHQFAFIISPALADGREEELVRLLNGFNVPTISQCVVALMVAGGVTGGRLVLLSVWPQFKKATDSSNKQALMPLQSVLDVVLVATLPAFSEEYLFRGALFPAIYPDWRGAVISGCVFGSLHITGNRNIAFAAWASLVGFVYGMSFLATGNLAVPMIAHSVSNIASAVLWLERNKS